MRVRLPHACHAMVNDICERVPPWSLNGGQWYSWHTCGHKKRGSRIATYTMMRCIHVYKTPMEQRSCLSSDLVVHIRDVNVLHMKLSALFSDLSRRQNHGKNVEWLTDKFFFLAPQVILES